MSFVNFFLNPTTSSVINYTEYFNITLKCKQKALKTFSESPTVSKFSKPKIKHFWTQTYTKTNTENQFRMHREYFSPVECLPQSRQHHQCIVTDNAAHYSVLSLVTNIFCVVWRCRHHVWSISSHKRYSEQANIAWSVTVNVKFTLEQATKPHTRRSLALLLL